MRAKRGWLRDLIKEEIASVVQARKMQGAKGEGAGKASRSTDEAAHDLLSYAFTMKVEPGDVRYIRFEPRRGSVHAIDVDTQLGNMDVWIGPEELARHGFTVSSLCDWLASNGARPIKKQARRRSPFSGPMGGYD